MSWTISKNINMYIYFSEIPADNFDPDKNVTLKLIILIILKLIINIYRIYFM